MKKVENCVSCGIGLLGQGSTSFPCPICEEIIGRCASCREQSVNYTCPKCGFKGP